MLTYADVDLYVLPKGSSILCDILDFAYRVHSELGNRCMDAKVNVRMVVLKHQVGYLDVC
jgi:(p)ppGpp synthase/HD superfamily hydrolase